MQQDDLQEMAESLARLQTDLEVKGSAGQVGSVHEFSSHLAVSHKAIDFDHWCTCTLSAMKVCGFVCVLPMDFTVWYNCRQLFAVIAVQ